MDFQGLKDAIKLWLHRGNITDAHCESFIKLSESFLSREIARIKHPYSEARADGTAAGGWVGIPPDYMALREIQFDGKPLALASNDFCLHKINSGGDPKYFCVADAQFRISPAPAEPATVEIIYYARLQALSDSNTSNWLLVEAEDLYLMACLIHASVFVKDAALGAMAKEQVAVHMASLEAQKDTIRFGDVPLSIMG